MISILRRKRALADPEKVIPIRKRESYFGDDGCVRVIISGNKSFPFQKFNSAFSPWHERVKFDEFGTAVWITMDRTKNMSALIGEIRDRYGAKFGVTEERISNFLFELYRNGHIDFEKTSTQGTWITKMDQLSTSW